VPAAIEFQREWGWDAVRARCHALAEEFVAECGLPAAASEYGQMVAVELPHCDPDDLQHRLWDEHRIEVPCFERGGRPLLRLSVQGYNDERDVERLVTALKEEPRGGGALPS
jgi:isopenicillin-N epimerase